MKKLTSRKEDSTYSLKNKFDVTPQLLKSKGNQESRGDFLEVSIPGDTIEIFLKAASLNTTRNVETCGILVGTRIGDVKVVSTIFIPKQTGTYQDCKVTDEDFPEDEIMNAGLEEYGWIHTHPKHELMFSSIDCHNQVNRQSMSPDYIGIVCALDTDKPGNAALRLKGEWISMIQACKEPGSHHHDPPGRDEIYEYCKHVSTTDSNIKLIDLR